ncbi:MAG: hypothetical protein IJT14_01355, partial [Rickettsiales bacterium]|nr:hypothetical protein [Rickettsiales bacterium]
FGFDVDFEIKWIGERNNGNRDVNTGCGALDKAQNVLSKLSFKNMLLYDCDTHKASSRDHSLYIKSLKKYTNDKNIQVGIENALVLDDITMNDFYSQHESIDSKGAKHVNQEFEKVKLCDYICGLPIEDRKHIYANLKNELEEIIELMKG